MFLSAADAARWMLVNLNGGELDGRRLVSEEVLREIQSPQIVTRPSAEMHQNFNFYCMGWSASDLRGVRILTHEGGEFGASSFAILCPEKITGVTLCLSRSEGVAVKALAYGLLERACGMPLHDWEKTFQGFKQNFDSGIQKTYDEQFAEDEKMSALPLESYVGIYQSPQSGIVRVTEQDGLLVSSFDEGEVYNHTLKPRGGGVFDIHDYAYLGSVPDGAIEHRVKFVCEGDRVLRLKTLGQGEFEKVS